MSDIDPIHRAVINLLLMHGCGRTVASQCR